MVSAQFLAGLLCKSYAKISKTMSSDSSLVTKNSIKPCPHILMHKAFPHHGQETSDDGEVTSYHFAKLAVRSNCFFLIFGNTDSCLGSRLEPSSFKLIVRPNAKINFYTRFSFFFYFSPALSSAPRERNGHLNSNRKTFAHIQVTSKCA